MSELVTEQGLRPRRQQPWKIPCRLKSNGPAQHGPGLASLGSLVQPKCE
jgi:hypothetical protein